MAGARIGPHVRIGDRVVLQFNAVVGSDGFSFVTATPSHAETARATLGKAPPPVPEDATWHRLHSLGGVEIGDDVEIGAGSTVDAGTIRATRIGRGTKLDNLVHVAHNVVIGQDCLLCALTGVAGSPVIGDRVVMGGKSGAGDNLTIGADVVMGAGTIALSNVPAGRVMLGYPAVQITSHIESYKALRRLPRLLARWGRDEKAVPSGGQSD
jgi:UDP-3-O-[3-hydroxymyristoyl] glucosamine N-acyltransferase